MIKKIVLRLTLGIIIGWIASCAWKAPLQEINVPVWPDLHSQAKQRESCRHFL